MFPYICEMNKRCCICGGDKDESKFSWKNKSKGIRHAQCKSCKREIDNTYYLKSKDRKAAIRKTSKKVYKFLRDYVRRLKMFGSCSKCGEDRWYVLDFHHIQDKDDSVANLIKRRCSVKRLKRELRKCTLLCSNCHRELHYFERLKN